MTGQRILYITSRVPHPEVGGFAMRVRNSLRILSEHYQVDLLCLSPREAPAEARESLGRLVRNAYFHRYSRIGAVVRLALAPFSGMPLQVRLYDSPGVRRWVTERRGEYDLIFCHLIRTASYARGLESPRVVDVADAVGRHYETAGGSLLWRWLHRMERSRVERYEAQVVREFDRVFIHTEDDMRALAQAAPEASHRLSISPMGVPPEFFEDNSATVEQPATVVFLGKMDYQPNEDAAAFFAHFVMPSLLKLEPQTKLLIVGAYPTRHVRSLAKLPGVEVTGYVEDPAEFVRRASVVVAPVRFGGGMQNKVIQAMAQAKPVVLTTLAARGVGGEDGTHYVVRDSPQQIAEAISGLFKDPMMRQRIGQNARGLVLERFTWDVVGQRMLADIEAVMRPTESLLRTV